MLPIYTNYLNPSEYGIMTLVQTLMGMLQVFLLLSLHGAVTRFYYDFLDQPDLQKEYLGSIFLFVVLFSTGASIILLIFNDIFGGILFKNVPINPFYFYLVGLAWVNSLFALPMALLRAQEKAVFFVIINIVKAILIVGFASYFIIVKGLGAEGALMAQLMITFIIVIFLFFMQLGSVKFILNLVFVRQSLLFSLPLLPHIASGWIINSSDRVILEKFVGLGNVGIYSLSIQVSMVLSIFYSSVNNALVPRYTRLRQKGEESTANRLLKVFAYVVLAFGIVFIPIAMYTIKIFTSSQYHDAITIIPILIIGQIIGGLYFIPVAKLFYTKHTKAIAFSSTIAAIINLIVNIILIPLIGIMGAALSTIIAESLRFFFIYKASKN